MSAERSPEQRYAATPDQTISPRAIVQALLRERWLIVGLVLLGAALGATIGLLSRREYVAESSFVPQSSEGQAARLAGLAAQFGVSVGGGGKSESPDFYASLLTSRAVLERTINSEYTLRDAAGQPTKVTLLRHFELEGEPPERRMILAVDLLRGSVSARPDLRTGIVRVTTRTTSPQLSELVNRRLLSLVTDYNLTSRQTQARAERAFVQARLAEAQRELNAAEQSLEGFLAANRSYEGSPQLLFEYGRLQRRVDLRQQVYSTLARSYEEARVEEVRNTPLITLVDVPEGSARRTGFGTVAMTLLGAFLAGALALPLAIGRQYLAARRATRDAAAAEGARRVVGEGEPRRWSAPAAEASPAG